jgi:hypothetical protein
MKNSKDKGFVSTCPCLNDHACMWILYIFNMYTCMNPIMHSNINTRKRVHPVRMYRGDVTICEDKAIRSYIYDIYGMHYNITEITSISIGVSRTPQLHAVHAFTLAISYSFIYVNLQRNLHA